MRTDGMNGFAGLEKTTGAEENLPPDKVTGETGTDRVNETGKEPRDDGKIRVIRVNASRSYDVMIGAGLTDKAGVYLQGLLSPGGTKKLLLVTDDCVNALRGDRCERSLRDAGFEVSRFVFPMGEASKNLSTLRDLLEFAAGIPLTRTDAFVALGGGVVGDLTGFAASVYLRGVPYIQIPTTLLAMVDSSVGGKTAVDLAAGKNLAGSFYQPSLVLADTDTLGTLPGEIFRDGCAEVIKYGMISDPELLSLLEDKGPRFPRAEVIAACVSDKRDAVEADETDHGIRRLLNFGHTPGHAIERLSDFRVTHGEAVAMGMALMTRAAKEEGICPPELPARLENLLTRFGLPTVLPEKYGFSPDALARAAAGDKKRAGDGIALILPTAPGKCEVFSRPADSLAEFFRKGM